MMMNAAELQQRCLALEAELRDREGEIVTLRELTQDLSQDVQAAKIIELSKKNRALNLAVEREKQRATKLQADLASANGPGRPASSAPAASNSEIEAIARSMVEQAAEAAEAAQKEAAQWKERLSQTTNKIAQLEQKVVQQLGRHAARVFAAEAENKKLVRALVREVGEDVPLARVLDESGANEWKGRREQILALRDQVKQLRAAAGQVPVDSKQDAAAKGVINKISKERNQELERLTGELVGVRGELEALRLKYDGATSRRKILEAELAGMRSKVAVVLEKTGMDDRLIAALKAEVATLRKGGPGAAAAAGGGGGGERAGAGGSGSTSRLAPCAGHPCLARTLPAPRPASRLAAAAVDDELWQELGTLRRRAAEQEEQIDRQEAIIVALQQRASTASTPGAALGIMLHGPPGSGKTSTIKAIANKCKRHIVTVNLSCIASKDELYDIFTTDTDMVHGVWTPAIASAIIMQAGLDPDLAVAVGRVVGAADAAARETMQVQRPVGLRSGRSIAPLRSVPCVAPAKRFQLQQPRVVCSAAASDSDPYKLLGIQRDADSNEVAKMYRMKQYEHRHNNAMLKKVEAAHSTIMQSQLTARFKGKGVSKSIAYADQEQLFPWRPKRWDATPKVIMIIGAMQLGMVAYGFQQPALSKTIFCETGAGAGAVSLKILGAALFNWLITAFYY
ncbi:Coiled-coil domain-containing protein 13 [Tetrabaena socialis]|uniref:Coiled-coil domain-containing protein 13 n=1 Tax=Tetrabaena socialis TaxID=47790 RepID=A0A2J8AAG6_9CHLO|nr:Coiled-coil domain-containing protein 13 [Tetrabaena socialis]|eukprot:PNH09501.1 Coiled-coil domain-containing protein 13 [Tetrabaena socialis]